MARIVALFLFIFAPLLACAPMTAPHQVDQAVSSADPMNLTVALVSDTDSAYCAGTWVASDRILTARHCVEDDDVIATSVHVRDYDGYKFDAIVKKVGKDADLALLIAPRARTRGRPWP